MSRVTELRYVPANQLRPNPRNWRTHPPQQRAALQTVLSEIGFAGAVLARETTDGELELIDGHLRVETSPPDEALPVLVLDLTAREADKLLAVYDPIAAMAARDEEQLAELLDDIETDDSQMQSLLAGILADENAQKKHLEHYDNFEGKITSDTPDEGESKAGSRLQLRVIDVPESFHLMVECRDEKDQQQLDSQLTAAGYVCRVLTV